MSKERLRKSLEGKLMVLLIQNDLEDILGTLAGIQAENGEIEVSSILHETIGRILAIKLDNQSPKLK